MTNKPPEPMTKAEQRWLRVWNKRGEFETRDPWRMCRMIEHCAMIRLLVRKGVITHDEYLDEMCEVLEDIAPDGGGDE